MVAVDGSAEPALAAPLSDNEAFVVAVAPTPDISDDMKVSRS